MTLTIILLYLGDPEDCQSQNITVFPTLKFFKNGPNSSIIFDNRHLAKHGDSWNTAMKSLFDFIDKQFGRVSFKVCKSLGQSLNA